MVEATLLKYKSASHSHSGIILILKGKFNMHYIRYSVSHQSNAVEDRWQAIDQLPYHYWQLMSVWLHFINLHFRSLVIKKLSYFFIFPQISLRSFHLKFQILAGGHLRKWAFRMNTTETWRAWITLEIIDGHQTYWQWEDYGAETNVIYQKTEQAFCLRICVVPFYLGNPH